MKQGKIYIGESGLHKTLNMRKIAEEHKQEVVIRKHDNTEVKRQVLMMSAAEIVDKIKRDEKTVGGICGNHTLIIDDLGKEPKFFGEEKLAEVINLFYERRFKSEVMPMVLYITTNLTIDEISERYGYSVLDRIIEMCEIVNVTGESTRQKYLKYTTVDVKELNEEK
jgi:DNA replication protein DnaC